MVYFKPSNIFIKVAFKIYDMDRDGFISNGELYTVLKMMVGNNLKDVQLQQVVDKTIFNADKDGDGKINYEGLFLTLIFSLVYNKLTDNFFRIN